MAPRKSGPHIDHKLKKFHRADRESKLGGIRACDNGAHATTITNQQRFVNKEFYKFLRGHMKLRKSERTPNCRLDRCSPHLKHCAWGQNDLKHVDQEPLFEPGEATKLAGGVNILVGG